MKPEYQWVPPFTVLMMPLDANGDGPEMEPKNIARTVFQVWDATFTTVSEHSNIVDAEREAAALNDKYCES
jgi:hypothetical protein